MFRISREEKEILGISIRWYALLLVAMVIAGVVGFALWAVLYPTQLNVEREAIRHSNPFVESLRGELVNNYAQWQNLETQARIYSDNPEVASQIRIQQAALAQKMHTDAAKLTAEEYDELPQNILVFLATH